MGALEDLGFGKGVGTAVGAGAGFLVGGPAGAAVGASIGSGIDQSVAADEASEKQAKAARRAARRQEQATEQFREDLAPFRRAGLTGLQQLGFTPQQDQLESELQRLQREQQIIADALQNARLLGGEPTADRKEALKQIGVEFEGTGQLMDELSRRQSQSQQLESQLKQAQASSAEQAPGTRFESVREQAQDVQQATGSVGEAQNQLAQFLQDRDQQTQFLKQDPVFQAIAEQTGQQLKRAQAAQGRLQSGETAELLQENLLKQGQSAISNRASQLSNVLKSERQGLQAEQAGFQTALGAQEARFNQLFDLASLGQSSAARSGQASQRGAGQIGQDLIQVGEAQAAGDIGQANAVSGAANSLIQLAGAGAFGGGGSQLPQTLPSQGGGGTVNPGAAFGGRQNQLIPNIFQGRGGGTNAATGSKSGRKSGLL